MEYKNVINFFESTPNQPCKFSTKNWIETNYYSRETYSTNSQTEFKTSILKSILCDYSDAYILVKRTIGSIGTVVKRKQQKKEIKQVRSNI